MEKSTVLAVVRCHHRMLRMDEHESIPHSCEKPESRGINRPTAIRRDEGNAWSHSSQKIESVISEMKIYVGLHAEKGSDLGPLCLPPAAALHVGIRLENMSTPTMSVRSV